ncbi:Protein of unknown function [Pyronema omphalodes CBS 100304]|uniref:Uncharacterized protein n=1 Tax=Pyronema omphalodes (strain CBS 100304) TaxID=1076935 RepID=U4L1N4_PYROM|nr:Protein of unknown function [Pyronema omphalodes CBS 100304]
MRSSRRTKKKKEVEEREEEEELEEVDSSDSSAENASAFQTVPSSNSTQCYQPEPRNLKKYDHRIKP